MEQKQLQVQDNMPSNSFHFRSIKNNEVNIVNICDIEVIGKTLSEGELAVILGTLGAINEKESQDQARMMQR